MPSSRSTQRLGGKNFWAGDQEANPSLFYSFVIKSRSFSLAFCAFGALKPCPSPSYMDKIIDKYKKMDEFFDYDLTKMLHKELCIQLSDDSRIVHNQMMAITHEYNHYSEGSHRIIENCMINLLIYISRLYKIQTAKQQTIKMRIWMN